ncbi:MAG: DNA primase catalytic subunit PriS, partial [Candidatus Methanomethylophilaceae archaeon]|nr:DNA primase catalytic subunit PriS [Candidatus Methanomethylophilaceae archaeon]
GFSPEDVYITFSGGRGYHAHVKMPEVLGLGSHERREIVDFVTSRGLNIDWVFAEESRAVGTANVGGRTVANIKRFRTIPPEDSGGWTLRMRNALKDVVNDVCDMDVPQIKKTYPSTKKNQSLLKIQEDLRKSRDVIFQNNKMATLNRNTQELLVKIMAEDVAIRISGEVDEPVTSDLKRLIRLPGSIHGKSGLRVTPLSRDELTDFDPMVMAIPYEYSDDPVKITMKRDYEFNMKRQHFKLSGITEVPEYAAVFLIGKKLADIGDGTKPKDPFF